MSDELRDELQTISGVGEATADEILDILSEYDTGEEPDAEAWVLTGYWAKALEAAEAGDDRQASMYLRRAGGD